MSDPTNTSGDDGVPASAETPVAAAVATPTANSPERPPPGTRLMALVRWLILAVITVVAGFTVSMLWGPEPHDRSHREDAYYCPMHPQIRSPEPGECPICHMNLEPIPRQRMTPSTPAVLQSTSDAGRESDTTRGGIVAVTVSLERQQLVGVATAPVTRRTLQQTLRLPGIVEAPESSLAQVHVRAPGFLERVAVRETGVRVTRGQTLAWIYSPVIYQAQQELLTSHRWSGAADNTAQSVAIEPAARRSLELLGMTASDIDGVLQRGTAMRAVPVRAPSSGYVTRFAAQLGSYATPETILYELSDLSRVWVVASAHEADLPRIRRGEIAEFVTPDAMDRPLIATVDLIEPDVSAVTRTARVRLVLGNPAMRLRPGQFGEVHFSVSSSTALVIPRDAVIDTGRRQYVFIDAGNGRFEPRTVRTGAMVDDGLQVLDGLREGERVVTQGNFMVDSESRLAASLAETPARADAGAAR